MSQADNHVHSVVGEPASASDPDEAIRAIRDAVSALAASPGFQSFVESAHALQARLNQFVSSPQFRNGLEKFGRFVQAMARANELVTYWEERAPEALRDAVTGAGLIVPVSQMSLPDVLRLLELFAKKGATAAVLRVQQHYDELFDDAQSLARLRESWACTPVLAGRTDILEHALKAHTQGLYAVVVPTLLAQAEGIVAELAGHAGLMRGSDLSGHVQTLAARDRWTELMISAFWREGLLQPFKHGDSVPAFSRHAILHGADTRFGTKRNSQTSILLIDHLRLLAESSDEVRQAADDPEQQPKQ